MPLIVHAVLSLAAGLLIGFGGHLFFGVGLATTATLLALFTRRPVLCAMGMLLGTGVLVADSAARSSDECAQRLLRLEHWEALIVSDAVPGEFVQATLSGSGCSLPAAIAVTSGRAGAGALVRVTGSAIRGERSIVVQRGALEPLSGGPVLLRVRAAAGRAIDRFFGERAPVVRALLIADSRDIDRDLRDSFADAGLVHMLSISGLHVGIIAAATLLLLRALRLSQSSATAGAASLTALYVLMIGAPAPAVRAGAMLLVVAASRMLQRPTSPWAALALGALVPLVKPEAVLSLGYQLSITGMVGLICAGKLMKRLPGADDGSWRGALIGSVVATLLASLATAPIIAWHFGRISIVAPLTNLIVAPIILLLQPLLFLALLLAPVPPVAAFVADASQPLLAVFEQVARIGAMPEWSSLDVAPSLVTTLLSGVAAAGLLAAAVSRRSRRYLILSGSAVTCIIWLPLVPVTGLSGSGQLEVHLIDVGQGDAIAVRLPDRRWLLIDAGRSWNGGDAGRRQVIPYLRRRGGELFAFVLSHPHSDHVGGAASIFRWLKPHVFFDAAYVAANEDYLAALHLARDRGIAWRRVRPGESIKAGGAVIEFLAPDSSWTAGLSDPNEASTVVQVRLGGVSILLTGDAERSEEEWLVEHSASQLRANVLKVAHHGSRTSTTAAFLDAVRPSIALISVGVANRYGHPSAEVLDRLAASGALILRTDRLGSVVVATDGKRFWVEAVGERWLVR